MADDTTPPSEDGGSGWGPPPGWASNEGWGYRPPELEPSLDPPPNPSASTPTPAPPAAASGDRRTGLTVAVLAAVLLAVIGLVVAATRSGDADDRAADAAARTTTTPTSTTSTTINTPTTVDLDNFDPALWPLFEALPGRDDLDRILGGPDGSLGDYTDTAHSPFDTQYLPWCGAPVGASAEEVVLYSAHGADWTLDVVITDHGSAAVAQPVVAALPGPDLPTCFAARIRRDDLGPSAVLGVDSTVDATSPTVGAAIDVPIGTCDQRAVIAARQADRYVVTVLLTSCPAAADPKPFDLATADAVLDDVIADLPT